MKKFTKVEIQVVKRELNGRVDDLAKRVAVGEFTKKNKMTIIEIPTAISSKSKAKISKVFMIEEKG